MVKKKKALAVKLVPVPKAFMEQVEKAYSADTIGGRERLRDVFFYQGLMRTTTSVISGGERSTEATTWEVVPAEKFKGTILSYADMQRHADNGTWTYEGMRVRLGEDWCVLTREIRFVLDKKAAMPGGADNPARGKPQGLF